MTEELKETSAAKFLNGLSRNASVDALDVLIRKLGSPARPFMN